MNSLLRRFLEGTVRAAGSLILFGTKQVGNLAMYKPMSFSMGWRLGNEDETDLDWKPTGSLERLTQGCNCKTSIVAVTWDVCQNRAFR